MMLKKHSSSQLLPSRSKRLWQKLCLWSQKNLQKRWSIKVVLLWRKGGYSLSTQQQTMGAELEKVGSPRSFTGEFRNKGDSSNSDGNNNDNRRENVYYCGDSGLIPQSQSVAFTTNSLTRIQPVAFMPKSSSLTRVTDWVNSLQTQTLLPVDDKDTDDEYFILPLPDKCKSSARSPSHTNLHCSLNISEVLHANSVTQYLNSSSTKTHITSMGLKVIPNISQFSRLRILNLSGNLIAHITPGMLPKGLHNLDLSRNNVAAIEGLRDLTRLRVLNLGYNRIFRIGQGLSKCTLIKELNLAGNKISDLEGLHRLSKLTVLDLSFNKITTAKPLGQLVANYESLRALNLLGNPIESNIRKEQLQKVVTGILLHLVYFNKQPIKPQRAQ